MRFCMLGIGRRNLKQVNEHQEECLNILQEECAEIIQAASKIKRFGLIGKPINRTETNLEHLETEMGDVLALITMVINSNLGITKKGIKQAKKNKMKRLARYMHTWGDSSGV